MLGVCPVCQQSDIGVCGVNNVPEEPYCEITQEWLLHYHTFYGRRCDGSGQVAEAVYDSLYHLQFKIGKRDNMSWLADTLSRLLKNRAVVVSELRGDRIRTNVVHIADVKECGSEVLIETAEEGTFTDIRDDNTTINAERRSVEVMLRGNTLVTQRVFTVLNLVSYSPYKMYGPGAYQDWIKAEEGRI